MMADIEISINNSNVELKSNPIKMEQRPGHQQRVRIHRPSERYSRRSECDNYSGITLLFVPNKVFSKVVIPRIQDEVENSCMGNKHGKEYSRTTIYDQKHHRAMPHRL